MGLGTRDQCWLGGIRGLRMTSSPTKAAFGRGFGGAGIKGKGGGYLASTDACCPPKISPRCVSCVLDLQDAKGR